jgi:hypothetical protein
LEGWSQDWRVPFAAFRAQTGAAASAGWPPSGADLVTQALGGCVLFHPAQNAPDSVQPATEQLEGTEPVLGRVMLFSAAGIEDRKVATHEHLAALSRDALTAERLARWKSITLDGAGALAAGNAAGFGAALSAYARELSAAGLERSEARADREALSDLKGVAGAKGMGALLSDGVLVCLRPESGPSVRSEVQDVAFSRGLRLVADGIRLAPGALPRSQFPSAGRTLA